MPMLQEMAILFFFSRKRSWTTDRNRWDFCKAVCAEGIFLRKTRNSSPPIRPTRSCLLYTSFGFQLLLIQRTNEHQIDQLLNPCQRVGDTACPDIRPDFIHLILMAPVIIHLSFVRMFGNKFGGIAAFYSARRDTFFARLCPCLLYTSAK